MLDLVFLAVAIFAIAKASKGEYNETACNISLVVGVIAGLVGCFFGISRGEGMFVFLNVIVMVGAFGIRFAARHLAKLYVEKLIADEEAREREIRSHARFSDPNKAPVYTDDTFDDEELRFGKGGYTDNNKVSLDKEEVYTDRIFGGEEPLFGKGGYSGNNKVSLEKKKVCLDKKDICTDKNFDGEELRFGKGGYTDTKL